jgi:hypothetical protein
MAVLGFTTTSSLIKDQSESMKSKGLESFGVSVIDDQGDKHDAIGSSNAQLHLFMQLKRGNVTHMLFQSGEQAEIFLGNLVAYYGEEKARKIMEPVQFIAVGDSRGGLEGWKVAEISESGSLDEAADSLV